MIKTEKTMNAVKRLLLSPGSAVVTGFFCGAASRFAEYKDSFAEDFTSRLMLWVLICVFVTLICETRKQAVIFVACFAGAMIVTNFALWYFLSSISEYAPPTVLRLICWIVFGAFAPVGAMCVYMTKTHNLLTIVLRPAIISVPLLITIIAFRSVVIPDIVFAAAVTYLIYFKKLGRTDSF